MADLLNDGNANGPQEFLFSTSHTKHRLVIVPQEEWLVLTIPEVPGWQVSISLCFDSVASVDTDVFASADAPTEELAAPASINDATGRFDTEAERRHLNAVSTSDRSWPDMPRNILKLHTTVEQLRRQIQSWYEDARLHGYTQIAYPSQNFLALSIRDIYSSGAIMCGRGGTSFFPGDLNSITYRWPGRLQCDLFQDVLRSSANTALAWQSLYTHIARMAYYDMLSFFDIPDTPTISWFQSAQFPRSSRGLKAVIAVLCVHMLLVGAITIVFLATSKLSRLGDNSWQTLAQASAPLPEDLLPTINLMHDGTLKKRLSAAGLGKTIVSLESWTEGVRKIAGLRRHTRVKDVES